MKVIRLMNRAKTSHGRSNYIFCRKTKNTLEFFAGILSF